MGVVAIALGLLTMLGFFHATMGVVASTVWGTVAELRDYESSLH